MLPLPSNRRAQTRSPSSSRSLWEQGSYSSYLGYAERCGFPHTRSSQQAIGLLPPSTLRKQESLKPGRQELLKGRPRCLRTSASQTGMIPSQNGLQQQKTSLTGVHCSESGGGQTHNGLQSAHQHKSTCDTPSCTATNQIWFVGLT